MKPITNKSDTTFIEWLVKWQTLILCIAAAFALLWTALYLQFTVDDAFISFRYGKTFVQSHVWNWNASGPRAEAYTSFLYAAISIAPGLLHISFPLFFKLVGFACVALMAYRLWTEANSRFAALLGLLLLGLSPWTWVHAYSGLETPLYMLLILEAGLCIKNSQKKSPIWAYAIFLLLPLARPEGAIFALVAAFLYWKKRAPLPRGYRALSFVLFLAISYFILRWQYFHELLPNPFYVKVTAHTLHDTISALASNISWSKGYVLTLASILLLAGKRSTRVFAGCSLLILLFLYAPHGMQMNYADRYWFQLTAPVLLLFLIEEDITSMPRAATVLVAFSIATISLRDLAPILRMLPDLRSAHIDIAQRIAPYAANHALAIGDAGAVPFYSNWVTYDFQGLCTTSVAHHGVTSGDLKQFNPDLILLYSGPDTSLAHLRIDLQANVVDYMLQSHSYELVPFTPNSPSGGLAAFLRKDTPQHDEIKAALQQNAQSSYRFSIKDVLLQRYVPWSN